MRQGKKLRGAKPLEVCSGTALTEVSLSWRQESKDTLWGANTPWQNSGSSFSSLLADQAGNAASPQGQRFSSRSQSKQGGKQLGAARSLGRTAPSFASAPVTQFPQLLKSKQCCRPGTEHPKHFHSPGERRYQERRGIKKCMGCSPVSFHMNINFCGRAKDGVWGHNPSYCLCFSLPHPPAKTHSGMAEHTLFCMVETGSFSRPG